MNEQEVRGLFCTLINSIRVTAASFYLSQLLENPTRLVSPQIVAVLELYGFTTGEQSRFLDDPELLAFAQKEAFYALVRSSILEAHQLAREIAESTGYSDEFENKDFTTISWLLRNCWGHGGKMVFNSNQRKKLPIQWKGIYLHAGQSGRAPTMTEVPPVELMKLIAQLETFSLECFLKTPEEAYVAKFKS